MSKSPLTSIDTAIGEAVQRMGPLVVAAHVSQQLSLLLTATMQAVDIQIAEAELLQRNTHKVPLN